MNKQELAEQIEQQLLTTIRELISAGQEALDYKDGSGKPILQEAIWSAQETLNALPSRESVEAMNTPAKEADIHRLVLDAYYAGFNQAHYSHLHPEAFPPKECESAGVEYLESKKHHISFLLSEVEAISDSEMFYNQSVMNPYSGESQSQTAYKKGFYEAWQYLRAKEAISVPAQQGVKEKRKEAFEGLMIDYASEAWKMAANAFRMYPQQKHTFSDVREYLLEYGRKQFQLEQLEAMEQPPLCDDILDGMDRDDLEVAYRKLRDSNSIYCKAVMDKHNEILELRRQVEAMGVQPKLLNSVQNVQVSDTTDDAQRYTAD